MCKMYNFNVSSRVDGAELSHSFYPFFPNMTKAHLSEYTVSCERKGSGFACPKVIIPFMVKDHNTPILP